MRKNAHDLLKKKTGMNLENAKAAGGAQHIRHGFEGEQERLALGRALGVFVGAHGEILACKRVTILHNLLLAVLRAGQEVRGCTKPRHWKKKKTEQVKMNKYSRENTYLCDEEGCWCHARKTDTS